MSDAPSPPSPGVAAPAPYRLTAVRSKTP
jgi:hypothetical protein